MKNIAQKIESLANQIEQLSIEVARIKKTTADSNDIKKLQELSDKLFHIQSEMRYKCYPLTYYID